MKTKILIAWLGNNDLAAAGVDVKSSGNLGANGPILEALNALSFDCVYLLCNQKAEDVRHYAEWLGGETDADIKIETIKLRSPVDFADIFEGQNSFLERLFDDSKHIEVSVHLSPGTPPMTAVSVLLGKARYPLRFIQSQRNGGAQYIDIPFNIAAEYLPELAAVKDRKLSDLMDSSQETHKSFSDIITNNNLVKRCIDRAQIVAVRNVPVLIMGESGTGKELFAKAIHASSPRADQSFVMVNCGAIPKELIDAELFGHAKGAFSGAVAARAGYFEQADGGTIFLDEFGELEPDAQVRLLRVLQSSEISRVGEATTKNVDVRVIAATNRNLGVEVAEGRFREDLYYRVAIGILQLPPLREREGDLMLLANHILDEINQEAADQPGYLSKKISVGAKKIILSHAWPGNVRELRGTLLRASLWSSGETLQAEDIKESLIQTASSVSNNLLPEMAQGFDIDAVLLNVRRHYMDLALARAGGNKKKASAFLGLKNYQTLTNWMNK